MNCSLEGDIQCLSHICSCLGFVLVLMCTYMLRINRIKGNSCLNQLHIYRKTLYILMNSDISIVEIKTISHYKYRLDH